MKKGMLFILLPILILAGCSIFGAGFIQFRGNGLVEEPTCWIRVTGSSAQDVFFGSASFRDPETSLGLVFSLPFLLKDEFDDVIYSQVDTQVLGYAITRWGYWFEISLKGIRTATLSSEVRLFHEGEPEIYRLEDDITSFNQWVNIRDVQAVDERIFNSSCLSLIETEEFDSLGIERETFCELEVVSDTADLRVGPGISRAVRLVAEKFDTFDAIGIAEVDGERWYQILNNTSGSLWVATSDVDTLNPDGDEFPEANCVDLPTTDGPPIIRSTQGQGNIASIQNCTGFTILRPIGTVSTGDSSYMWSPVEGADQYILNFSDYQGNYATSIVVDGSQTSTVINTGSLATGSQLSFEVVAMANGERTCSAYSGPITRQAGFVAPDSQEPEEEKKESKKKSYKPPG